MFIPAEDVRAVSAGTALATTPVVIMLRRFVGGCVRAARSREAGAGSCRHDRDLLQPACHLPDALPQQLVLEGEKGELIAGWHEYTPISATDITINTPLSELK